MKTVWVVVMGGLLAACGGDDDGGDLDAAILPARLAWRDPMLVPGIESPTDEQGTIVVRADGLEAFFNSTRTGGAGCADIWRTTRATTTDTWGAPTVVTELNTADCDGATGLSPDGRELLLGRVVDGVGTAKLYRATRATTSDAFGAPVEATELNIAATTLGGSLSGDGLVVVFQAAAAGAEKMPAYQAERATPSGAFGTPHPLTELGTVNGATLAPDGLHLITYSSVAMRFQQHLRASTNGPFSSSSVLPVPEPNPAIPYIGGAFIASGSGDLYYNRRSDDNHVELWFAVPQ